MSNEEILKEYGITERTSHHNYDYLYKSILSAMQQAQEEAVKAALEMAADTLSDNDCVMNSLTTRCNSVLSLHSQVMDKLNQKVT